MTIEEIKQKIENNEYDCEFPLDNTEHSVSYIYGWNTESGWVYAIGYWRYQTVSVYEAWCNGVELK